MKPYTRAERISTKIQQAITELLTKKLSDPRIDMATVSRVKLTPDLRLASIYVTVFGDEDRIAATLAGFKNSKGFIKKHIAPQLGLKYMPELRFFHDDSFDKAARMDALIDSVVKDLPKDSDPGSKESE
ncbi:MAG: 30S ribosome-binding factor RbfA [Desulfotignum sp.]|nr:30S ribosome-binding factor RbfA [Desulfotignum sp.]MCF8086557.1 30S ribosome-binding factor RbfA [Desulfotignum sp.]MCF8136163.1 30S ribosome-binding factor RbfA [Desulfotignum sp.]